MSNINVNENEEDQPYEVWTMPYKESRHKNHCKEIRAYEKQLTKVIEKTRNELSLIQTAQSGKKIQNVTPSSELEQIDRREKILKYYAGRYTTSADNYLEARSYPDETARKWKGTEFWEDVNKIRREADNLSFTLGTARERLRKITEPNHSHRYDVQRRFSEDIVYDFYRIEDSQEDLLSTLVMTRGPALPQDVVYATPGVFTYVRSSFCENASHKRLIINLSLKAVDEQNRETHRRANTSDKSDRFDDGTWDIQCKRNSKNTGSILSVYTADKKVLAGIENLEIGDPPMVDDVMIRAMKPYKDKIATSWIPYSRPEESEGTKDGVEQAVICLTTTLSCL